MTDMQLTPIGRIESRQGLRQLSYMKELEMGTDRYRLVTV